MEKGKKGAKKGGAQNVEKCFVAQNPDGSIATDADLLKELVLPSTCTLNETSQRNLIRSA